MVEFNIGDTVLLKCKVISKGIMCFTEEGVLDLVPVCKSENDSYTTHKPWSVFENDVEYVRDTGLTEEHYNTGVLDPITMWAKPHPTMFLEEKNKHIISCIIQKIPVQYRYKGEGEWLDYDFNTNKLTPINNLYCQWRQVTNTFKKDELECKY